MKRGAILVVLLLLLSVPLVGVAQSTIRCRGFLPSRLLIRERGRRIPGTDNNLRDQPSADSQKVGEIPGGGVFIVLDGPQCDPEGIAWWQVDYDGLVGWTAEGLRGTYWLQPLAPDTDMLTVTNAHRLTLRQVLQSEENVAYSLALRPDGQMVALGTGFPDNVIHLWNTTTGTEVAVLTPDYQGDVRALSFNRDGSLLAVGGLVGDAVQIWAVDTGERIAVLDDSAPLLMFSPVDNRLAYSTGFDLVIWDADNRQEVMRWSAGPPSQGLIDSMTFSPDGALLATGDISGFVYLWDVVAGTLVQRVRHKQTDKTRPVSSVAFNPQGNQLASVNCHQTGDYQGSCLWVKIAVWNTETGQRHRTLDLTFGEVVDENLQLAFNTDETILAVSDSSHLWLVDAWSGEILHAQSGFRGWQLAISADGRQVLGAGTDAVVQIWEIAGG